MKDKNGIKIKEGDIVEFSWYEDEDKIVKGKIVKKYELYIDGKIWEAKLEDFQSERIKVIKKGK